MNSPKLLETDIKARLVNHLYKKGFIGDESVVINELTIGSFSRRVDLVVASPNELVAYEIKSGSDNLNRLLGQTIDYYKHFDKVIVVAAPKHITSILQLVPNHIGVWELSDRKVTIKRRGVKSKVTDKLYLTSFLNSYEITKLTPAHYKSLNRQKREESIHKTKSIGEIREEVYRYLNRKFSETSDHLKTKLKNGVFIEANDIEKLSVYIPERRAFEHKKSLKSQLWETWKTESSS